MGQVASQRAAVRAGAAGRASGARRSLARSCVGLAVWCTRMSDLVALALLTAFFTSLPAAITSALAPPAQTHGPQLLSADGHSRVVLELNPHHPLHVFEEGWGTSLSW